MRSARKRTDKKESKTFQCESYMSPPAFEMDLSDCSSFQSTDGFIPREEQQSKAKNPGPEPSVFNKQTDEQRKQKLNNILAELEFSQTYS